MYIQSSVKKPTSKNTSSNNTYQVVIAQWLARRLATEEVPGSNPGKGENLLISE